MNENKTLRENCINILLTFTTDKPMLLKNHDQKQNNTAFNVITSKIGLRARACSHTIGYNDNVIVNNRRRFRHLSSSKTF